jgi:GntR family transcriptional regulator / MocR family aminotransferase
MRIPLDRSSGVPLYMQVANFIEEQVQSEGLKPGAKLPSNRELAFTLGVSRTVVIEAYAELISKGIAVGKHGSGTYIGTPIQAANHAPGYPFHPNNHSPWISDLTKTHALSREQDLEKMLRLTSNKGLISFAEQSSPDILWPIPDFQKALKKVFASNGLEAVNQNPNNVNFLPLCETISQILASEGISTQPENILITSGSQQGLSLVAQTLLHPGDAVLVETPTYYFAINLFHSMGVKMIGIPMDRDGMIMEHVENALAQQHPRLIFTMPTFHHPTGICMSSERRRKLVTLATQYNIPVLEDDFIGNIRLEGRAEPALKALDRHGDVIYMGTFSKILMPGLRLGFLAAEKVVCDLIHSQKILADLGTSVLLQHALNEFITVGQYQIHLRRIRQEYRRRRDEMVNALHQYLPQETTWIPPKGGRYIWLKLPFGLSSDDLFPVAIEEQVSFIPGRYFFPNDVDTTYLQLNFAANPMETNREGIQRLGKAVERLCLKG